VGGWYGGRCFESDLEDVGLGGEKDWDGGVVGAEVLGGGWGSEKVVRDAQVNQNGGLSCGVLRVTCKRLEVFLSGRWLIAMLVDAKVDLGDDSLACLVRTRTSFRFLNILCAYMRVITSPYVLVYISIR